MEAPEELAPFLFHRVVAERYEITGDFTQDIAGALVGHLIKSRSSLTPPLCCGGERYGI